MVGVLYPFVASTLLNNVSTFGTVTNIIRRLPTCILLVIQNYSMPLDTKWLEGSTNTVRETVVELKMLLNMELHDNIEFSQGLAEVVFPDYNLPFQIDDSLLNSPRTTHI